MLNRNQQVVNPTFQNRRNQNRRNQREEYIQNVVDVANQSSSFPSMIFLLFLMIVVGIFYFIYQYWNEIQEKSKLFTTSFYMLNANDESNKKALCKSGCKEGKCVVGSGECKVDGDCEVCVDEKGGFYGSTVDLKDEVAALEEEDVIQERRIRELEKTIQDRNQQIADLNRYIEYVNRKERRITES